MSLITIIFVVVLISGFVAIVSGLWLLYDSFFKFKKEVKKSLNISLDVVKVVKTHDKQDTREGVSKQQVEKEDISKMEQLLASLAGLIKGKKSILGFRKKVVELIFEIAVPAKEEQTSFFVAFPRDLQEVVEKQIHSFFPSAHIERVKDYNIFQPESVTVGSYLKLKRANFYPIKTYQQLETDSLHSITNALSKLENVDEGAAIQIIFHKSNVRWKFKGEKVAQEMQQGVRLKKAVKKSSIHGKLLDNIGKEFGRALSGKKNEEMDNSYNDEHISLTPEEQEIIKQLEAKSNKIKFDVNIRLLASANGRERAEIILNSLENAFTQFDGGHLNKFKTVRDKSKNAFKLSSDFIMRLFRQRQKIILSTEELASIFHFPIFTTETPKLNLLKSKAAPPPDKLPKEGLLLGYNDFRGVETEIRIGDDDRRRHMYIVGQTGTGKSTFIEEMAKQDAKNKKGMCIIDPHGDLIDHVMESIPKERAEDVIYFDPSDTERPFGLNMMEYDEKYPEQKTFVINEMISIFDKLYDLKQTGGPMFEQYMRNAMLLVMDSPETGSTLMEVPRVFRDQDFRRDKIKRCKDMTVVDFWEKEAEKAGGDASMENISPYITSKLTTFISNDMMRPIIAQQHSTINFRKVMDEGKILLVNLSKGKIGEINSHLLGMVIVGKLLMSALSRVDIPEKERRDFYLYIDEFQNFTTDSISQILAEARKYKLSLTIAHQFIGQLSEEISKAVFGNVGSMSAFRVGSEDAEFLEKQFAPVFDANDLINIDNYQCYSKLLVNNQATDPFNMKTYPPSKGSSEIKDALKELSRYKYGRSQEIVEAEIEERFKAKPEGEEEKEDEMPDFKSLLG
jgi:hypothetical protein